LRGEVRVQFFGDDPQNLLSAPYVWLSGGREKAGEAAEGDARRYTVLRGGSGRAGEVRLALEGVTDRDAADALRGKLVQGDAEHLAPLEDDEFYWHQLVGCEVRSTEGDLVGVVCEIWETGAHDVLVVRSAEGEQHLFSTARELTPEIDLAGRRVVVELLPGMLGPDSDPVDPGRDD
jgi:16S rRNA processing protein RimM